MKRLAPLVLACALVPVAACGGGGDKKEAAPTTPPPTSAAAPSPTVTPVTRDPFTGAVRTTSPVVGVKVDNAPSARPFIRGLDKAALVYTELVEGGSTRFLAIYNDAPDVEVGPIRSVRESDVELLGQYGPLALAFSGGNDGVLATLRRAVQDGRLNDVSFDAFPAAYRLAERRKDARNFFARPSRLAALRPGATPARDTGLTFAATQPGGAAVSSLRVRFSQLSSFTVRWDATSKTFRISEAGRAINGAAPQNIIIQYVPIRGSRYVDKLGTPTPYTVSLGTGRATVLRDGRQYSATWKRATQSTGTRYVNASGQDVPLTPGRTWIMLVPTTGSVSATG